MTTCGRNGMLSRKLPIFVAGILVGLPAPAMADAQVSPDQLVGLWKAKRRFGPDVAGPLIVEGRRGRLLADVAGRVLPVREEGNALTFEIPGGRGRFEGRWEGPGTIHGHWIRPGTAANLYNYASPVILRRDSSGRWVGSLRPMEDTFTFYLLVQKRPDGTIGVVLRNPERDIGTQLGVDRLVASGSSLRLVGKRGGQDRDVMTGSYDPGAQAITFWFPGRGGSFDFVRDGDESDFYPRGRNPGRYSYRSPPQLDDGWAVASADQVGISKAGIERFIQLILAEPMESALAPQVDAVLVARHGKLVVEEYFHGQSRDRFHETRSASKSMTSITAGAAIQAGVPLSLSSRVYQVMNGGVFPPGLDPQKQSMTLENLLNMASGFFCDDSNENAPGNETGMIDQTQEPDYYRYILKVPLESAPGQKAVYCSAVANLALGMVGRATGASPLYAFDSLVAKPLKITRYSWDLDPAGNPYGGGSAQFVPRDFAKFGQLMLDGGVWNGHRVLGADFVRRATSATYHMANVYYGYLWWSMDWPYKNRSVRAHMAFGAGGQVIAVIPDLDLVVTIMTSNYGAFAPAKNVQQQYIPNYVLPAVRERGDDLLSPGVFGTYVSPYGKGKSEDRSRIDQAEAPGARRRR